MSDGGESGFPEELSVGSGRHVVRLSLRRDRWAVLGEPPRQLTAAVVCRMGEQATVLEGSPPQAVATGPCEPAAQVAPVYAMEGSEGDAVPTGRVSVRASEGRSIEELSVAIEAAGYRIDEIPIYAPHSAWLVARSSSLADSLGGLKRLEAVAGLVHVEPQLLRESRGR